MVRAVAKPIKSAGSATPVTLMKCKGEVEAKLCLVVK
jgi:hypothetical protein